MKRLSLRLRLALLGAVAICFALSVAGFGLTYLFERHVYRTQSDELDGYARQIIGGLQEATDTGEIVLRQEPEEQQFQIPYSGLYWEVVEDTRVMRSRSLWDYSLKLPEDSLSEGQTHYHQVVGPADKLLLVAERRISLRTSRGPVLARVVVASDLTRLRDARDAFAGNLAASLFVLGLVLTCATWIQLTIGLRPLAQLRAEVAGLIAGRTRRLSNEAPLEVQPLVAQMNQLLAAQEAQLDRARARAADLAHGLKTPLAALAADARLVRRAGHDDVAESLDRIGETMRRHVERELARARIRASGSTSIDATPVRGIVEALIRTLKRTDQGARLSFENCVSSDVLTPIEKTDLTEALGNLLDNAARHAATRVRVSCGKAADSASICVEDDGPGLDPSAEALVRQRGGRVDQGGSAGLGLAIVQDILDAYGWRMEFARSELGGLLAMLRSAAAQPSDRDARA